jgi:hypothetical protein
MTNEPTMTGVLENVEREISRDPEIGSEPPFSRFAPPRLRQATLPSGELENIQASIRKSLSDMIELHQRLATYCDVLKVTIETLQRSAG